ncbi:hypothetical protein RB653_003710 [Dictyostelium firmibasis]|uniref:NADH dehydrogenase [ubiquinone] 1 alpha subcomplex subunit 1 n=1 Tax=Dictyostelium firmibasis TaxID=79012 RepID=A0AAN7YZC9_9MYCE
MTWVEVLPVFGIITGGLVFIGVGLDAAHRLFHYGKPHRYARERVEYRMEARDEHILHFRSIKDNPKKLQREINSIFKKN